MGFNEQNRSTNGDSCRPQGHSLIRGGRQTEQTYVTLLGATDQFSWLIQLIHPGLTLGVHRPKAWERGTLIGRRTHIISNSWSTSCNHRCPFPIGWLINRGGCLPHLTAGT